VGHLYPPIVYFIKKFKSKKINHNLRIPKKNNKRKVEPTILKGFKNKKIFSKTIRSLFKSKKKINNEYYMDMVLSYALKKKYKIDNLIVNSYESWGTPEELIRWEKNSGKI